MASTTINAPTNPYRPRAAAGGDYGSMLGTFVGPSPRRFDTESGPGLTAGDIDRIARDHFRDGHAAAEREAEVKIEALQAQLAVAYDEGYTAGRVERAQGLAREVFSRLFGPQAKVIEARGGPKGKAHAALDDIEAELVGVREFVAGLFSPHDAVAAERAAAQVARDEA